MAFAYIHRNEVSLRGARQIANFFVIATTRNDVRDAMICDDDSGTQVATAVDSDVAGAQRNRRRATSIVRVTNRSE